MQEARTENHEPIKTPKDMTTKAQTIKSRIELLEKNSGYIFGANNVRYIDTSLVEVKADHATGTATISIAGGIDTAKLLRFMEFYPVNQITPGWDAKGLILTIDVDKMNDYESDQDQPQD